MKKYSTTLWIACAVCLALSRGAAGADGSGSALSLPEAVRIAVENNAVVKAAEENLKGAEYERFGAKADRLPKMSVRYSYTHMADAPYMQGERMPPTPVAHRNLHHWDLTVIQPLFSGFALSTQYEMAGLGVKIKEKEKEEAILDVTKGVKSAYYNVLLTRKLLFVADDAIKSLRSHERDNQRFYDRGVIRLNDLLRSRVALANAIQNREKAQAAARMALADLNRWLAFEIHRNTRIEDIETASTRAHSLEEMTREGMKNRPLLQVLHLSLDILDKAIHMEKSGYYPHVALIAGYGRDGEDPLGRNNDYSNDHNAWVAVEAKWTIFDSYKTRSRVNKAKADKSAFMQKIRSVEDGIRLEIINACLDLEVAEKNIETAKASLTQAEENLRITRLGRRQQAATSTEVLDARSDLTLAQTRYYMALYGSLDAAAALERAIGLGPPGRGGQAAGLPPDPTPPTDGSRHRFGHDG